MHLPASVLSVFAEPAATPWSVVPSITDGWKLAAFAIAAVLAIAIKQKVVPKATWWMIALLVAIPIGASIYQDVLKAKNAKGDSVYRVRVTVLDLQGQPLDGARVRSTVGGEKLTADGSAQLIIPAATLPQDGKLTIFAAQESTGLAGRADLQLGDDRNPALTIPLTRSEASVRGQVIDKRGNAVAGARVSVVGYGTEAVTTGADGNFVLPAHAAIHQQVELHAERPGYKAVNQFHPAGDTAATLVLEK